MKSISKARGAKAVELDDRELWNKRFQLLMDGNYGTDLSVFISFVNDCSQLIE